MLTSTRAIKSEDGPHTATRARFLNNITLDLRYTKARKIAVVRLLLALKGALVNQKEQHGIVKHHAPGGPTILPLCSWCFDTCAFIRSVLRPTPHPTPPTSFHPPPPRNRMVTRSCFPFQKPTLYFLYLPFPPSPPTQIPSAPSHPCGILQFQGFHFIPSPPLCTPCSSLRPPYPPHRPTPPFLLIRTRPSPPPPLPRLSIAIVSLAFLPFPLLFSFLFLFSFPDHSLHRLLHIFFCSLHFSL